MHSIWHEKRKDCPAVSLSVAKVFDFIKKRNRKIYYYLRDDPHTVKRERISARHSIKDGGIQLICHHNHLFVFFLLSRGLFNIDYRLKKSDSAASD